MRGANIARKETEFFQDSWNQSKSYQLFGSVEWSARGADVQSESGESKRRYSPKFMWNFVSAESRRTVDEIRLLSRLLLRIISGIIHIEYEWIIINGFSPIFSPNQCPRLVQVSISLQIFKWEPFPSFISRKQILLAFINFEKHLGYRKLYCNRHCEWDDYWLWMFPYQVNLSCVCVCVEQITCTVARLNAYVESAADNQLISIRAVYVSSPSSPQIHSRISSAEPSQYLRA